MKLNLILQVFGVVIYLVLSLLYSSMSDPNTNQAVVRGLCSRKFTRKKIMHCSFTKYTFKNRTTYKCFHTSTVVTQKTRVVY